MSMSPLLPMIDDVCSVLFIHRIAHIRFEFYNQTPGYPTPKSIWSNTKQYLDTKNQIDQTPAVSELFVSLPNYHLMNIFPP